MKKFNIIISKLNIYTGQVKKIKNESRLPIEVMYIEDILNKNESLINFENSIIYFLCCNSILIPLAIQKLEKYNCYIINKEYLVKNYSKLEVQKLLLKHNVNVPKIYTMDNIENAKFPIFCKENRHEGIIMQVYNKISLKRFFEKFNSNDFYLEENMTNNNTIFKELKIYYVDKKLFLRDNENNNMKLLKTCQKVSSILNNLEVFSADIIQRYDGEYFIIDINSSAGFYLLDEGRRYFLDFVSKI